MRALRPVFDTLRGRLDSDKILAALLQGGVTSLSVRVSGLILGLAVHVLLSRMLGATSYGSYAIALAWVLLLVVPAKFGLDLTALRFAPVYMEEGRVGSLRGLVGFSVRIVAAVSFLLAIGILLFAWISPDTLGLSGPGDGILIVWIVVVLAYLGLLSAYFRAVRRIFLSQFFEQILRSALLICCIGAVALVYGDLSTRAALFLTALSATGALLVLLIVFRRVFNDWGRAAGTAEDRSAWIHLGVFALLISIVQQGMAQSGLIVLGWMQMPEAAAHYAVAARLAAFVPFVLVALSGVSASMIASAHVRGDTIELMRLARINARLAFAGAFLLCALLAVFSAQILSLFGAGFERAAPVLWILLLGGLINSATGSVGLLTTMTDNQQAALAVFSAALVAGLVAAIVLIPSFGAIGAAISNVLSVSIWSFALWVIVRRRLGVDGSLLGLAYRSGRTSGVRLAGAGRGGTDPSAP